MSLTTPLDGLAVAAIAGYQRYISPRKGFVCAHRVLHGGESCSEFLKQVTRTEGFWKAIQSLRPRFRACRAAGKWLRAARQTKAFSATLHKDKDVLDNEPGPIKIPEAEQPTTSKNEQTGWLESMGCLVCLGGLDGCGEPQAPDCAPGCDLGGFG